VAVPIGPDPVPNGFARSESSRRFSSAEPAKGRAFVADIDGPRVARTFAPMVVSPDTATEYLFAQLFVRSPELRSLFPMSMITTREETARNIAGLIRDLLTPAGCEQGLRELAVDLRRYGIRPAHYVLFGEALTATLEHLNGAAWTARDAESWRVLIDYCDRVMRDATADESQPAWWVGEIVQHEQRTPTIAVVTIRPDQPLPYRAGQHVGVQVPRWPRAWRDYSVANAPRSNGLIDLHVRAVPGGMVSNTLVSHYGPGNTVVLSAARGDLRAGPERDLLRSEGSPFNPTVMQRLTPEGIEVSPGVLLLPVALNQIVSTQSWLASENGDDLVRALAAVKRLD